MAFRATYYLKRPELQEPIVAGICAGSAHRQLARSLGCAPSTVTRQASRLGRHCAVLHAEMLAALPDIREPVGVDHFETHVDSQFDRVGIATAVGHRSWFIYDIDPAPHRRAGRLSAAQRRILKRRSRGRRATPPGGYVRSQRRVLDVLLGICRGKLDLFHDDHPAYRACLAKYPDRDRVRVRVYRNPKRGPKGSPRSLEARLRDEAMFPVDLLHGLWRHTDSHHGRETIAFARRTASLMERAHIMATWRNLVKKRSERRSENVNPATDLGLAEAPWTWAQVLARRLFPGRVAMPASWMQTYRREWSLPDVGAVVPHALTYAF